MSLYKKLSLLRATAGAAVRRTRYVMSLFNSLVLTPEIFLERKLTGALNVLVASTFLVVAYNESKNTLDLTLGNSETSSFQVCCVESMSCSKKRELLMSRLYFSRLAPE